MQLQMLWTQSVGGEISSNLSRDKIGPASAFYKNHHNNFPYKFQVFSYLVIPPQVCEDMRSFIKSPEESLKIKTKHISVGIRSTIFPCDKNSTSKLWLVGPVYKGRQPFWYGLYYNCYACTTAGIDFENLTAWHVSDVPFV